MTDNEYAKHLFELLWESSADCCSKCAFCPKPSEICSNLRYCGLNLDTAICFVGMRAYAEGARLEAPLQGAKI